MEFSFHNESKNKVAVLNSMSRKLAKHIGIELGFGCHSVSKVWSRDVIQTGGNLL